MIEAKEPYGAALTSLAVTWPDGRPGLSSREHMAVASASTGKDNAAAAAATVAYCPRVAVPAATTPDLPGPAARPLPESRLGLPLLPLPRDQYERSAGPPARAALMAAEDAEEAEVTLYRARGENRPGGAATINSHASRIMFDGSAETGELLPGPADLLAAALAACILKNVERFAGILAFSYRQAQIEVEVERAEPPPRIVRAHYTLTIATDEPGRRLDLLHRNILRFGTITNTLAAACELSGTIHAEPPQPGRSVDERHNPGVP